VREKSNAHGASPYARGSQPSIGYRRFVTFRLNNLVTLEGAAPLTCRMLIRVGGTIIDARGRATVFAKGVPNSPCVKLAGENDARRVVQSQHFASSQGVDVQAGADGHVGKRESRHSQEQSAVVLVELLELDPE
jgi:hypothetical protein